MSQFQLYAVDKRTNRIQYGIGTPDTYDRCHNLKRAQSDYQPVAWFSVLEAGLPIGHEVGAATVELCPACVARFKKLETSGAKLRHVDQFKHGMIENGQCDRCTYSTN